MKSKKVYEIIQWFYKRKKKKQQPNNNKNPQTKHKSQHNKEDV